MKTFKYILSLVTITAALQAGAWGQKGHDVTAYIAEKHLTPATQAVVDSLLEGKSMVYWANWLDNASHTRDYAYTKTWHYKNVDEGVRYEEAQANPSGDAVTAIKSRLEILSDPHASYADKQLALKILIHVVGDLHQPMHMGHATDLGGNRVKVKFHNRDTNLHSAWDSAIIEAARNWSFSEWQMMIDRESADYNNSLILGNIDSWAKQTMDYTTAVYNETPEGTNISFNEIARWTPVIEQQLLKGGLRLAHLLNTLYDPEYK